MTSPDQLRRFPFLALLLALTLALGGCSTFSGMFDSLTFGEQDGKKEQAQEAAESLIVQGMDAYNVGDYYEALQAFDQILDQYPFSPQAILAELKSADCHFYRQEYLEAKALYKQFEERHPTNEAIPYVIFQIGMCDFKRTDRIDRDITGAEESIKTFSRLLRAFPNSPYTREAKAHIEAARSFLANHEYFVAVFYVRTEKYDQAKHRLNYLINMYPKADIIPKARKLLARLEAGKPPRWGLRAWLPDLTMPALKFWQSDEAPTAQPD